MNWYFITLAILYILQVGLHLGKHGEPREGKYNFYMSLVAATFEIWMIYKAIETGL